MNTAGKNCKENIHRLNPEIHENETYIMIKWSLSQQYKIDWHLKINYCNSYYQKETEISNNHFPRCKKCAQQTRKRQEFPQSDKKH